MLNRKQSFIQWHVVVSISVLSTLVSFLLSTAPVASKEEKVPTFDAKQTNLPLLQITPTLTSTLQSDVVTPTLQLTTTPTPTLQSDVSPLTSTLQSDLSPLTFTLDELGYSDTILNSPFATTAYRFRLPKNWVVQGDNNFLILDLSYDYRETDPTFSRPNAFGDLTIVVNNELFDTFVVEEEFEHRKLQIQLPQSLFDNPNRGRDTIDIIFNANFLCEIPHSAQLTIHSISSQVSLNYNLEPVISNLSLYPEPFYQQASFLSDNVRFVLPSPQTVDDATNAVRIAAKLGDLTSTRLPISSTLDIELADLLSEPASTLDENLLVLGQPENNQLLSLLNETTELPVSLHRRQLEFTSQGPVTVLPGEAFSYTFTATNTSTEDVTLSLIDALPQYTELVECVPNCEETPEAGIVTWSNSALAPDEFTTFSLTLRATDLVSDDITIDSTATLIEDELGPLNARTLSTTITASPEQASKLQQDSDVGVSDYFFMYNGQAVAENDGIVQEVVSPWNENRAILIVTGLNKTAVEKASSAVSSSAELPGMVGPVALIKEVNLSDLDVDTAPPPTNITFQDLGYKDVTLRSALIQVADYVFSLPYGWHPSESAYLDLHFSHTQLFTVDESSVTVNFNGDPVISFPLEKETASNGEVRISLPQDNFRPGEINHISVETKIKPVSIACGQDLNNEIWFTIKSNSEIFLDRSELMSVALSLENFPHPFDSQPALFDLMFALPENPTPQQWEYALNLAAVLGDSADGDTVVPIATLGASSLSDEELSNYHVVAIGQPTVNPLIQKVNSQLPQPFIPNSTEIQQQNRDIVFRMSPNVDLGLIQLIPSPWNEERALLAVTGTSEEGVNLSASAVIRGRSLNHTLVLVQADRIEPIDVSGLFNSGVTSAIATAVPELVITSTVTPALESNLVPTLEPTPSTLSEEELSPSGQPIWLIPLVIGTTLAVVVILAVAFWQSRQRK